jgi:hypothetical protein
LIACWSARQISRIGRFSRASSDAREQSMAAASQARCLGARQPLLEAALGKGRPAVARGHAPHSC